MADAFFTKTSCDRCGETLAGGRTMSIYNEETICLKCAEVERKRPDYETARSADVAACKRGNFNFKGIGLR